MMDGTSRPTDPKWRALHELLNIVNDADVMAGKLKALAQAHAKAEGAQAEADARKAAAEDAESALAARGAAFDDRERILAEREATAASKAREAEEALGAANEKQTHLAEKVAALGEAKAAHEAAVTAHDAQHAERASFLQELERKFHDGLAKAEARVLAADRLIAEYTDKVAKLKSRLEEFV